MYNAMKIATADPIWFACYTSFVAVFLVDSTAATFRLGMHQAVASYSKQIIKSISELRYLVEESYWYKHFSKSVAEGISSLTNAKDVFQKLLKIMWHQLLVQNNGLYL